MNSGKESIESFNHRRPRSADSRGQNRQESRGDRSTRQTSLQMPRHGGRAHSANISPAVSNRTRQSPVAGYNRRVHVVPPNAYVSVSPAARQRNDNLRYPTDVFVVPSPPVSLPPSTRLNRVISPAGPTSDNNDRPIDDHGDLGNGDTSTADDAELNASDRTIFDVVLRYRSLVAAVVCVIAFLSPIVMVSIPRRSMVGEGRATSDGGYACDENCESAILSLSVRLIVVAVGSLAVLTGCSPLRRLWSAAEMPRLEDVETALTAIVVLIAVVFWSFYVVRIAGRGVSSEADYGRTVSFARSMADTLIFVHGLAALVLGHRCRSTSSDFVVLVVRSPDGLSTTFSVSSMSIQQLALTCLRRCGVEFNTELDKSGYSRDTTDNESEVLSVRSGSDRTSVEHDLRVARRRARLIAAAEEALDRGRRPPHREAAAEGVCMALHGYLRAVGQLHRYNREDVLEHLDACVAQETTTKVFVSRYLTQIQRQDGDTECGDHQRWRLACDVACNSTIADKTRFCLRRVDGVSMMVTVRRLPSYHLKTV